MNQLENSSRGGGEVGGAEAPKLSQIFGVGLDPVYFSRLLSLLIENLLKGEHLTDCCVGVKLYNLSDK